MVVKRNNREDDGLTEAKPIAAARRRDRQVLAVTEHDGQQKRSVQLFGRGQDPQISQALDAGYAILHTGPNRKARRAARAR